MKVIIQRVKNASVTIDGKIHDSIETGLLVLLGISTEDTDEDLQWLCNKIPNMRLFSDSDGKINLSVQDIKGEIMVISQFTLYASTKKGNRPSFLNAAKPEIAIPIYEKFLQTLKIKTSNRIASGVFGADMKVALINDGPVTIYMDSKSRE